LSEQCSIFSCIFTYLSKKKNSLDESVSLKVVNDLVANVQVIITREPLSILYQAIE
jgi:hypothetical protein